MLNKISDKQLGTCLGIIATLLLVFACLGVLSVKSSSSPSVQPTEKSIEFISYQDIRANQKRLTGVQWDEYQKSIIGKRVEWTGYVDEVKKDIAGDNYVWVDMDNPPDGVQDLYFKYPVEKSLAFSKGQRIKFRGDFDGGMTVFFFLVDLKNAEVLQ